jgi:HEPN domain-containing protein
MTLRTALVSFARQVFRDQADKDYIVARACYRMNLRDQFLWASLQACEKYLKGTLLFNERSARYDPVRYNPAKKKGPEFGHDLESLLKAVKDIGDLPLDKPGWLPDFLKYLTIYGNNRYLSRSTYTMGDELRRLDEAVWVLRRVCQVFDWTPTTGRNAGVNRRPDLIAMANRPQNRKNPALFRPFGIIDGFLEKLIKESRNDPARQNLVWSNMFFAKRQRHRVTYTQFSSSENPPHTRSWIKNDPSIMAKIDYYIKLS